MKYKFKVGAKVNFEGNKGIVVGRFMPTKVALRMGYIKKPSYVVDFVDGLSVFLGERRECRDSLNITEGFLVKGWK